MPRPAARPLDVVVGRATWYVGSTIEGQRFWGWRREPETRSLRSDQRMRQAGLLRVQTREGLRWSLVDRWRLRSGARLRTNTVRFLPFLGMRSAGGQPCVGSRFRWKPRSIAIRSARDVGGCARRRTPTEFVVSLRQSKRVRSDPHSFVWFLGSWAFLGLLGHPWWVPILCLFKNKFYFGYFLFLIVGISHHFRMADGGLRPSRCFFWCFLYCFLVVLVIGGLCPCKCTQRAMFVIMRRRVLCLVKWSQPPSGKMKLGVTGYSQWHHNRKADRYCNLWLCMSGIFPVCRQNCKANGVANDALFAKWCLLECIDFIDMPNVNLGCSYSMGFRHNVPPLYSEVSLMVMT